MAHAGATWASLAQGWSDYARGDSSMTLTPSGGSAIECKHDLHTSEAEFDAAGAARDVEVLYVYTDAALTKHTVYTYSGGRDWTCTESNASASGGSRFAFRSRLVARV